MTRHHLVPPQRLKPVAGAVVRLALDRLPTEVDEPVSHGAGIAFVDPDGRALFMKRSSAGDHAGEWCFPGGGIEEGETAEDAAVREAREECGASPYGARSLMAKTAMDGVHFTTYAQPVKHSFTPRLNEEHSEHVWAPMGQPPEPLHPGVRAALGGMAMDDGEFKESDHPRAASGQFGSGGGGAVKKTSATAKHEQTTVVDGQRLTASGGPLPAHVQALKIPPAWSDVSYAADPKADLLATGKDAKGRAQSIYSDSHDAKQAAAKFARIQELNAKIGEVTAQNEEARNSADAEKKDSADALSIIMNTGIRPGSDEDTGAAVKAYGATTLEGKHVVVTPDGVSLKFVGKKGVSLDIKVTDPSVAQMLRDRAEKAGAGGKLFPATSQGGLLEHTHTLDGGGFKSKDFRTLKGTKTAIDEVKNTPPPNPPKTEAEFRKAVMAVAKKVAAVLGNTPTVALQSYIDPAVFSAWKVSHA